MTTEELARAILKFSAVFLLIVTPFTLVLFYRAPNPPEHHVGPLSYAVVTIICLLIMGISFWYCRKTMGWFGGKKK
jgi:hypothetical protein